MSSAVAQHAEAFTVGQSIGKEAGKPSLRAVPVRRRGGLSGAELVRGSTRPRPVDGGRGGMAGDGGTLWVVGPRRRKHPKRDLGGVGLYGEHIVVRTRADQVGPSLGDELTVRENRWPRDLQARTGVPLAVYEERIALAGSGSSRSPPRDPASASRPPRHEKSLVRTVLGVEPSKRALTLAVDALPGLSVQPLRASTALVARGRTRRRGEPRRPLPLPRERARSSSRSATRLAASVLRKETSRARSRRRTAA